MSNIQNPLLIIVCAILLAGCASVYVSQDMKQQPVGSVLQFSSEQELTSFISDISSSSPYYGYRGGVMMKDAIMMSDVAIPTSAAVSENAVSGAGDSYALDYSETNVQVAGIDELDTLKNDGQYIYTLTDNTLFIVQATPASDADIVSKITFDGYPSGIFVEEDRLLVVGSSYSYRTTSAYALVYDISNREEPTLVENLTFDGYIMDGRLINNTAYLVSVSSPTIDHPWPILYRNGVESKMAVDDIYYFPHPYTSASYVTVHALNLQTEELASSAVLTDNVQTVYMSINALYLVSTDYVDEWQIQQDAFTSVVDSYLTADDKALIEKINAVDSDVLSKSEKEYKIQDLYRNRFYELDQKVQDELQDEIDTKVETELASYTYFENTQITKIELETLTPSASGSVPGHVLNQFALDEYDNVLRVATTISARWTKDGSTPSDNHIYTLDADLSVLGSLTGLGHNESIYSVRYVADRAYVVTFRQVDPFYVIDLSDATNPTELGQLKIPGFSRYLHPIDETHILGLGQDATDTGRVTGMKIALYDVSDTSNPKEVALYVGDEKYESSAAMWEHKAFLYDARKNLLVIPIQNYDYEEKKNYAGAYVFKVEDDSITKTGFIDHTTSRYSGGVERSLYIGENLYTKSYSLIRINDLETLQAIKDVKLPTTQIDGVIVY